MNIVFKPFVLASLLTILLAVLLSQTVALLMPKSFIGYVATNEQKKSINFDIVNAFNIQNKPKPKKEVIKKVAKQTSGVFLLKDFSISAVFLDGNESMVILRDGGIFLALNEVHKGYRLIEVFPKKAKFKKGADIYIAFLSPKDEKNFQGVAKTTITESSTQSKRVKVTGTASKEMFENIKYKNGKYYIPQDMMKEYKNMNKIFSSIAIQAFNIDGYIKFKVTFIKPNSIFAKMGLRKYDYIQQVNNEDFKSISEPIKYFQNLENIKELSLTIKRGNKTKELKYEIF